MIAFWVGSWVLLLEKHDPRDQWLVRRDRSLVIVRQWLKPVVKNFPDRQVPCEVGLVQWLSE